jgi:hypothetical protein
MMIILLLPLVLASELLSVVLISRHGIRAPLIKYSWDENEWSENPGELLPEGIMQHYILGEELREVYIKTHKLIPDQYNATEVFIQSTEFSRTISSAQAMMMSFFPNGPELTSPKNKLKAVPPFEFEGMIESINELGNEALPFGYQPVFVDMEDKEHDHLLLGFSKNCWKISEHIKDIQNTEHYIKAKTEYEVEVKNHLEYILDTKPIEFEEAAVIGDTFETINLSGMSLPKDLTTEIYSKVLKIRDFCNSYMFDIHEASILSSSEMLYYIINTFSKFTQKSQSKKLSFFYTHDTFLISILKSLDIWDGSNPAFASTLAFELYKSGDSFLVQIKYNDELKQLPSINSELSFKDFKKLIETWALHSIPSECRNIPRPKIKMFEPNYFHTYIS